MSMSQCIICADLFDGVERVMAAPCGHVYHSKCLLRWLDQKKSCPECRQKVLRQNVLELYFNINSTQLADPVSLTNEIDNLKTLLQESSMEASKLVDRNKQLIGIVENDSQTIQTLRKSNMDLKQRLRASLSEPQLRNSLNLAKTENEKLKKKLTLLESIKDSQTIHTLRKANMDLKQRLRVSLSEQPQLRNSLNLAKTENEKLKKKLTLLESIKTVVTGAQNEADEILNHYTNSATPSTDLLISKRLAYCCSLTKRELKRAIDEKNKLRNEAIEINTNLGLTSSKLRLSYATVKKLKKKVQKLESAAKRNLSINGSEFCDSLNLEPSTSTNSPCPKQSTISCEMTPITAGPENVKKRKMNVVVLDKQREKVSVAREQSVSPVHFSPIASCIKEANSVSRIGYNGLGGHHSIIVRSEFASTFGRSKKFSLVPTKKKFRKL